MTKVIKEWDGFEILAPPLAGAAPLRGLKRGRAVSAGELLARHENPWTGDLSAPCSGIVAEINEFEIIIERDDQAVGEPPQARELASLQPDELRAALKELGYSIPQIPPGDPLIINALPEPGRHYAAALLSEHRQTMLFGLAAAQRLWPGRPSVWAVPAEQAAPKDAEVRVLTGPFPLLPRALKQKIAGRDDPEAGGVLDSRELYFLGRLWRTGLPLVRLVISLGAANYFVPVGSRVEDLLRFANMYPKDGEVVVADGLTRGRSLARLTRGLGKEATALSLVRGLGPKKSSRTGLRRLADGPYLKTSLWSRLRRLWAPLPESETPAPIAPPAKPGFKARLKCGSQGRAPLLAEYHGPANCRQADFHDGGPLLCPYGCLGYGDCAAACPYGAILMREGFPAVDEALCTACGNCLAACPKNLFELAPEGAPAFIPCASKSSLKKNAEYCPKSCLGCGRCRKVCPAGAVFRSGPTGAMTINQDICQTHSASCGQKCKEACPRRLL